MCKRVALTLSVAVVALSLAGCKSDGPLSSAPLTGSKAEPKWVSLGASAFPEELGKAFYAVGVAEMKEVPRLYLRRRTATERGKNEIAGQLRTFVTSVFKDYTEAALTPSADEAESQSMISNVQKSVIDETLVGAETRDTWKDPSTGDFYVLVRVSMDSVAGQLRDKIKEVEKKRLRIEADKAHEELDKIIEKRRMNQGKE